MTRALVAGAALLVAAVALAAIFSRDTDPAAEARSISAADGAFETADASSTTLARVADVFLRAGRVCDADDRARCDGFLEASAWAQVAAVEVLRCTKPGLADAQRDLLAYLDALREPTDADPPGVPRCR